MPVAFLNPGLLLGALAAAVPILIHILSRRRIHQLPFSDLRFLEEVQTRQSRSLGLRRLLLLLLRVLAVLCVVLAIARPQFGGLAGAPGGLRSVLFVLDGSASMQTQHDGGTRFAAARQACAEMMTSLPKGSEVQVVVAGASAEPLFATWTGAVDRAADTVLAARVTDGPFDLAAALRAAETWVTQSRSGQVEMVLLSDLQRYRGGAPDIRQAVAGLVAAGEVHLLIQRVAEPVPNGGILSVRLPLRAVRPAETVTIEALVRPERAQQPVRLELDGRPVAEAVVSGPAHTASKVEFTLTAPGAGLYRGRVIKDSDRLPVDDSLPFVFKVWDEVAVLIVHGADRGAAGRGGWRYLAEALAPGGKAVSLFSVEDLTTEEVVAGDLSGVDVVLWVDPEPLGRQLLAGLLAWLADGGATLFCVGDPTLEGYLNGTLLPALGLPPEAHFRSREAAEEENLTVLARLHPVFAELGSEAVQTLSDVTWRRYFGLSEGQAEVLLAFTSEAPALLEATYGKGAFFWLPFNLNLAGTPLALSPMFLPLVQRLTAYLAQRGRTEAEKTVVVGARPELHLAGRHRDRGDLGGNARLGLLTPETAEERSVVDLTWHHGEPVLVGPVSRRQGFYTFTAGEETLGVVAVAPPARESDPELTEVAELQDFFAAVGLPGGRDLGRLEAAQFATLLRGTDLSPWLFALAFLLLCVESFIGRGARVRPGNV